MNAYRSTADLARNNPQAYELLGGCTPDLSDDSEIVRIQPDPEPAPPTEKPTAADLAAMHASRPDELPRSIRAMLEGLTAGLEALADHALETIAESVPVVRGPAFSAGQADAWQWAASCIRRLLASLP